jgi:hypothetical protein
MPSTLIAHITHDTPIYGAVFSIGDIQRANRDAGHRFFSPDTMRFFGSRVMPTVYAGRFFITSERSGFDYNSPRTYTVREFFPDASIETVGEFNAYKTPAQARAAIKRLRDERHTYYFDGQHGKSGRRKTYVVTADDPWAALDRLHSNFRVMHCGRAADYMLTDTDHYVHIV